MARSTTDAPEESVDLTPGVVWTDAQLDVVRDLVRRAYRAELEVKRLASAEATANRQERAVENWKDERIRGLESRIAQLEDYVLRLRTRIHTVADDVNRSYADDLRELHRYRQLDLMVNRTFDRYRNPKWPAFESGSGLQRATIRALLDELDAERRSNPMRQPAHDVDFDIEAETRAAEGWDG